ncbi:MAG: PorT family protein [Reichenbachiella sp.]
MKHLYTILILVISLSGVSKVHGQEKAQGRKTYIGVKGGYNISTANIYHNIYRYNAEIGWNSGFQGGLVVMNFLRHNIGIQAELNYTQKGYVQRFEGQEDYQANFDYMELPLLFNLHTGKDRLHIFLNAGCYFEYLVRVKEKNVTSDPGDDDFSHYDESRDPKWGYGYRAGAGVFYDFNFGTLMLEGAFNYSLGNFIDPITFDTGIPNFSNHIGIGVTIGYLFSFGDIN